MKVIFLGTNGWYDTPTGNTICTLIRAEHQDIILDAGIGFYKIDHYIPVGDEKPTTLLLSHFHLDHIYGLHMLVKCRFPHGLTLCGPAGTRQIIDTIVNSPFTVSLDQLPFTTTVFEVPEETGQLPVRPGPSPVHRWMDAADIGCLSRKTEVTKIISVTQILWRIERFYFKPRQGFILLLELFMAGISFIPPGLTCLADFLHFIVIK